MSCKQIVLLTGDFQYMNTLSGTPKTIVLLSDVTLSDRCIVYRVCFGCYHIGMKF